MACIKVVERCTFLEMECGEAQPARCRAMSDSCLWHADDCSCADWDAVTCSGESSGDEGQSDGSSSSCGNSWSDLSEDGADEDSKPPSQQPVLRPPGVFAAPASSAPPTCQQSTTFVGAETRTTLLLRNLPSSFEQQDVLSWLDSNGWSGKYNFMYLPMDFATGSNVGYAFVNMINSEAAVSAKAQLEGFSAWADKQCRKVVNVCWSSPNQGLDMLVAHFRNSRVMHGSVPRQYRPVLLEKGSIVAFPKPTKRLRAPC